MNHQSNQNTTPRPFRINIPQADLDDLNARLASTRFPDAPTHAGWSMGTDVNHLKDLVAHWQSKYDWREHEAALNELPQFTAEVDGVTIHFVHAPSKVKGATPLLLTHGWPDTFHRFSRVIGPLTDPEAHGGKAEDAFHVIVPSIPGFGFSGHQARTSSAVADLWAKLMTEVLGYKAFMAHGGDIGSLVTLALARQHPEVLIGIHLTDAGYPLGQEPDLSAAEQTFAQFIQGWWFSQGSYAMLQSTKPQSLATALNDSPAGLASWILSFTDTGADQHDVEAAFGGRDALLTNITLYWLTQTAASSARMYLADAQATYGKPAPARSEVPTAFALLPREAPTPRDWVERQTRVVRYTKMPGGGHFAALEEPGLFVDDLRSFASEVLASARMVPQSVASR